MNFFFRKFVTLLETTADDGNWWRFNIFSFMKYEQTDLNSVFIGSSPHVSLCEWQINVYVLHVERTWEIVGREGNIVVTNILTANKCCESPNSVWFVWPFKPPACTHPRMREICRINLKIKNHHQLHALLLLSICICCWTRWIWTYHPHSHTNSNETGGCRWFSDINFHAKPTPDFSHFTYFHCANFSLVPFSFSLSCIW